MLHLVLRLAPMRRRRKMLLRPDNEARRAERVAIFWIVSAIIAFCVFAWYDIRGTAPRETAYTPAGHEVTVCSRGALHC
jgi:hypothetical protein